MTISPLEMIHADQKSAAWRAPKNTILSEAVIVAGAGGTLGSEITQRLLASSRFRSTIVLTEESFHATIRGLKTHQMQGDDLASTPIIRAEVALIMFEAGRKFCDREKALWTPRPEQLLQLARWLLTCGVRTLIMVLPHQPNRLPQSLQQGLATLDEQALSSLGFSRLVVIRSAQAAKEVNTTTRGFGQTIAGWMFDALSYMIPSTEQPLRSVHLAEFVLETIRALEQVKGGTFVCGQQLLHESIKKGAATIVSHWLMGGVGDEPK